MLSWCFYYVDMQIHIQIHSHLYSVANYYNNNEAPSRYYQVLVGVFSQYIVNT